MPQAPRPPRPPRLRRPSRPPKPPSPPRTPGRLRLAPVRSQKSLELDGQRGIPAFIQWTDFRRQIRLNRGEHITIVGTTGSGKTVLARELLTRRDFVAVLGTKNEDDELYGPFEKRGYEITDKFDAEPDQDESRVIFRPRMSTPDERGLRKQKDAFEAMLFEVWEAGNWTIYADEIWYLTNRLKLASTFETFWTAGRSNKITVVAATQLPVSIPLLAFDQATHLFLFRNTDRYRINRMAEFAGSDTALVRSIIPELPRYEFLYIDTRAGGMLRSKVELRG